MLCMTFFFCTPLQSAGGFISFQDKNKPDNVWLVYYPKYCISTDFNHNMMCILADKNIFAGLPSSPAFLN